MRILFTALNCLGDPSSGAAISVRTIMNLLGDRGNQVISVTGAGFDSSPFATEEEMLRWLKFRREADGCWSLRDNHLKHLAIPAGSTSIARLIRSDLQNLTDAAFERASAFAPDVVISFGGTAFELEMRRRLKENGAKVAFYLANPNYRERASFDGADIVLTDSKATQDLYSDRLGLKSDVIGKFVRRPTIQSNVATNFITFVNPSYEKGVTLFFRIAEMMRDVLPSARFMVVESRTRLDTIEAETGIPFSSYQSIRRIGLQTDMSGIFSRTRILVMPSLWHESGSRLAVEAISLGIPVVASNHGGFPEHLADGATLIRVPDALRKDPRLIPPQSAALPWVAALSGLWSDPEFHAEKSRAALEQWKIHDPAARVDNLEALLTQLIVK